MELTYVTDRSAASSFATVSAPDSVSVPAPSQTPLMFAVSVNASTSPTWYPALIATTAPVRFALSASAGASPSVF